MMGILNVLWVKTRKLEFHTVLKKQSIDASMYFSVPDF